MLKQRRLRSCFLPILMFSIFFACTKPNLPIAGNDPLPPIIKTYRHIIVSGGHVGLKKTDVFVEQNDTITIMATGTMDYCPGKNCGYHRVKPEDGWPIMARIGEENRYFRPIPQGHKSGMTTAYDSGYLFVGYRDGKINYLGRPLNPSFYRDNRGAFSIDIIVWKNDDYVQIADFLEQMKNRDPQNDAVADAFKFANIYREILVAEAEAYEELDEAQKMIQELKEETVQPKDARPPAVTEKAPKAPAGTPSMDDQDQKKIRELEGKISELMKTLAHLDGMKKELDAERKKAEDLARELEEKEHREQELLSRLENRTQQPPLLMIASPKDGLKTEAHAISFSGVAQDDTGLTRIDIFLNDNRIDDGTQRGIAVAGDRDPRRFDFNRRMALEKGENRIRIRAVDSDGLSAEKSILVHCIEKRTNIWAVVVGINDYSNVRKLKYAANDAHAFHDLLVRQNKVPPENIFFLTDRQASLVNLRSVLGTRLKNQAGKDDMVIVYFAGHGATEKDMMSPDGDGLEKYLLPCDADLTDLYSTALPMREISHIFRRIRSERIIFIADACYSGGSGGRTTSFSGVRATISDAFMDRVTGGKGTVIITASAANEVSGENDRLEHGVFTYYLLEALKGDADIDRDGLITVDEVYGYVSEWVPKATGQEQHPVKKGSVTGQLVLSVTQE